MKVKFLVNLVEILLYKKNSRRNFKNARDKVIKL